MDTYTNGEFVFTKVAAKNGWVLFLGKGPKYGVYELVYMKDGVFPADRHWGKYGFTFLSIEDAVKAMKILTREKTN